MHRACGLLVEPGVEVPVQILLPARGKRSIPGQRLSEAQPQPAERVLCAVLLVETSGPASPRGEAGWLFEEKRGRAL
ncbi:MAG TPA: hypothetical protein VGY58_16435, partial [Gemmataceae bacterium]|nr:hypothetical protein [Gemmataceae bacterium]